MNDFETLKQMFDKANISYQAKEYEFVEEIPTGKVEKRKATRENGENFIIDFPIKEKVREKRFLLTVEEGYSGFYTNFYFRENGFLYKIGAYE